VTAAALLALLGLCGALLLGFQWLCERLGTFWGCLVVIVSICGSVGAFWWWGLA
jgi:hypothetical protein